MKKVIRISVGCLLLSGSFFKGIAQDKTNSTPARHGILYSAGIDGAIATGELRDAYRYSLGGSAEVDVPIVSGIYGTASAGFQHLFHRDNDIYEQKSLSGLQLMPIKAGLKYFPVGIFYVQAGGGCRIRVKQIGRRS